VRFEFVETAVSRIEVMLHGDAGPVVVMHPEAFGGIRGDAAFAEALVGQGMRFVGMNPRGSGGSMGPMTGITLHDMAADAIAVIERYDEGPAIFIGHAGGNRVGRMVATLRPDLVRVLVLLCAGGRVPAAPEVTEAATRWRDDSLPWAERLVAAEVCFLAPGNKFPEWFPWPDYSFSAATAWGAAGRATDKDEWWAGGSGPIFVVQGAQDPAAPPENGHLLRDEFPDRVELVDIEGAGHFPQIEQPQATLEVVVGYLRREGYLTG
jgi:pimeloyl-ACP methyl ester carboxylesterase